MSDIPPLVTNESSPSINPQNSLTLLVEKFSNWCTKNGAQSTNLLPQEVKDEMILDASRFRAWATPKIGKPENQGGFTGGEETAYFNLSSRFEAWNYTMNPPPEDQAAAANRPAALEALQTELRKWAEKWGGNSEPLTLDLATARGRLKAYQKVTGVQNSK